MIAGARSRGWRSLGAITARGGIYSRTTINRMTRTGESTSEVIAAIVIAIVFFTVSLLLEPLANSYRARDSRGREYRIHADDVPWYRKEQIRSGEREYAVDRWGAPEKEANYWGN
ncbi:hypothetical protein [Stieleria maiorica]|nr:hypothetical protein [Stieleria maiorica]